MDASTCLSSSVAKTFQSDKNMLLLYSETRVCIDELALFYFLLHASPHWAKTSLKHKKNLRVLFSKFGFYVKINIKYVIIHHCLKSKNPIRKNQTDFAQCVLLRL